MIKTGTGLVMALFLLGPSLGRAQEGPVLYDGVAPPAGAVLNTVPGQPVLTDGHGGLAGSACPCTGSAGRHHGLFKQLWAWATHVPHNPSGKKTCCLYKPLLHIPPLYPFFLDRCGGCAGGTTHGYGPMMGVPAVEVGVGGPVIAP